MEGLVEGAPGGAEAFGEHVDRHAVHGERHEDGALVRREFADAVADRGEQLGVLELGFGRRAGGAKISERAIDRGYNQVGTLGSGNHYLEVQVAKPEDVRDKELAEKFGITIPNQVVVMFHCGSRGFGHQVATDYLQTFLKVMEPKYGIKILDRELACAPFE